MDRNKLLEILNNKLNQNSYIELMTDYCVVEHGKDATATQQLIQILLSMPMLMFEYAKYAIEYYKVKFTIYEVIDRNNNVLMYY